MTVRTSNGKSLEPGLDADVVGGEVDFTPPLADDQKPAADKNEGVDGVMAPMSPAEDQNQPGFIGDRNLPNKSRKT